MHKKGFFITGFLVVVLIGLVFFFRNAPPSPVYYAKEVRESFQSLFVFGSEDRANWLLTLSDKRLDEAQYLTGKNMKAPAQSQFNKAIEYQSEAEILIKNLKDITNTTYLEDKLSANKQKAESVKSALKK